MDYFSNYSSILISRVINRLLLLNGKFDNQINKKGIKVIFKCKDYQCRQYINWKQLENHRIFYLAFRLLTLFTMKADRNK